MKKLMLIVVVIIMNGSLFLSGMENMHSLVRRKTADAKQKPEIGDQGNSQQKLVRSKTVESKSKDTPRSSKATPRSLNGSPERTNQPDVLNKSTSNGKSSKKIISSLEDVPQLKASKSELNYRPGGILNKSDGSEQKKSDKK